MDYTATTVSADGSEYVWRHISAKSGDEATKIAHKLHDEAFARGGMHSPFAYVTMAYQDPINPLA